MLHDTRHQLPLPNHRLELLRHRLLHKHPLLLPLDRQRDIHARALGGNDLDAQALFREVDLTAVGPVDEDRRYVTEDLDGKGGGGGDGEGGDGRVEEERDFVAVDCARDEN